MAAASGWTDQGWRVKWLAVSAAAKLSEFLRISSQLVVAAALKELVALQLHGASSEAGLG